MSPGADNEGFDTGINGRNLNGIETNVENVVIVGAGPAGLMLG